MLLPPQMIVKRVPNYFPRAWIHIHRRNWYPTTCLETLERVVNQHNGPLQNPLPIQEEQEEEQEDPRLS